MRVFIPPENRIIQSDTVPIVWAVDVSSKWIPSPSVPLTIPTNKNNNNAGNPNLELTFPTTILTKNSKESEKTYQKEVEEIRDQEIERKLFEKAIKGEEKEEESEDASFYNPMREE